MAFLAEVFVDVLSEYEGKGNQDGMTAEQIRDELGFERVDWPLQLCRGVLNYMKSYGEVDRVESGGNAQRWHLVREE